jgi:hypothetical protein
MKTGNWIGIFALLALALSALAEFRSLIIILEVTSLLCFFYAGFRGSRWWFTVPVVLISMWLFLMSQGH